MVKSPQAEARYRVLAIATEWSSVHGGLSTFNRQLCHALVSAGVSVVCVVLKAAAEERLDAEDNGVFLIEAPSPRGTSELFVLAARPVLPQGFVPNVIIGHARVTGPAAKRLRDEHFPNAKRLHFIHMAPDEIEWDKLGRTDDAGERAEERTEFELDLARTADLVVAVGPRLHHRLENDLFPDKIHPLRFDPGFDAENIDHPPLPPTGLWRILLLGRMEDAHSKGLDLAAQAIGLAVRRRDTRTNGIEFVVRGAPVGSTNALRTKVLAQSGLPSLSVVIRPYSTQAERLAADLRRATLVLMPSRTDGFGLVGVEAIIAGTPVLISESSGLGALLQEALPTDDVGRVVVSMSGDDQVIADRWARAIEAVLSDREAAFQRAADIRCHLAAHKKWSTAIQDLLTALSPSPLEGKLPDERGLNIESAPSRANRLSSSAARSRARRTKRSADKAIGEHIDAPPLKDVSSKKEIGQPNSPKPRNSKTREARVTEVPAGNRNQGLRTVGSSGPDEQRYVELVGSIRGSRRHATILAAQMNVTVRQRPPQLECVLSCRGEEFRGSAPLLDDRLVRQGHEEIGLQAQGIRRPTSVIPQVRRRLMASIPRQAISFLRQVAQAPTISTLALEISLGEPAVLDPYPWELLAERGFLADPGIAVAVWRSVKSPKQPTPRSSAVLLVGSASPDGAVATTVPDELDTLTRLLRECPVIHTHAHSDIAFPGFAQMLRALQPSAIHIVTRGKLSDFRFNDDSGADSPPHEIGAYLTSVTADLIVLNAGGSASSLDGGTVLARQIATTSPATTVGMAADIPGPVGPYFSQGFFGALALGCSVIEAFGSAVQAVQQKIEFSYLWSTPIMYARPDSNVILFPADATGRMRLRFQEIVGQLHQLESDTAELAEHDSPWPPTGVPGVGAAMIRLAYIRDLITELDVSSLDEMDRIHWGLRLSQARSDAKRELGKLEPALRALRDSRHPREQRAQAKRSVRRCLSEQARVFATLERNLVNSR
jgi:glycosyltransferase involved in cell wall biosynthesis